MDPKRVQELGSEYRIAYQQLQHLEQKAAEALAAFDRDRSLALRRYELARKAFMELVLGEDDEFLGDLEG